MWEDWAIFKQTVAFVFKTVLDTVTAADFLNLLINSKAGPEVITSKFVQTKYKLTLIR